MMIFLKNQDPLLSTVICQRQDAGHQRVVWHAMLYVSELVDGKAIMGD